MNEHYLVASYFAMALIAVSLGGAVYLFLHRPFRGVTESSVHNTLRLLLNTIFPLGIIFPALLGFLSVSYFGCSHHSYENIVQDRAYLTQKAQEQASSILLSIALAIVAWDFVILVAMKVCRAQRPKT